MANEGGRGGSFSLPSWRGHCSSVSFSDGSPVPYLICGFTIQKFRLSREVQYHGQLHELYHGLWRYTQCAVVLHKWCLLPIFWFLLPSYSYGGWLGKIISMLQLNLVFDYFLRAELLMGERFLLSVRKGIHKDSSFHATHLIQITCGSLPSVELQQLKPIYAGGRIKERRHYVTGELWWELNKTSIAHAGHSSLQESSAFELRHNVCVIWQS